MILDPYWIGLLVLVPLVTLAAGHNVILRPFQDAREKEVKASLDVDSDKFRKTFLRVYLVVMGSEWLQGPYMYSLFKDEKTLDERTVAALYVTTYISAATSAFATGYLADRFGRRAACLAYCGIHSLASISVWSDAIEVLVAGRILGGIGLNLLWTVFESWMVTEYNVRGLEQGSFPLSSMFGIMTKYNCITAIIAGILSHCIVSATGTKTSPFLAGLVFDACAAILMLWTWNENQGTAITVDTKNQDDFCADVPDNSLVQTTTTALKDVRIWVLSFASCCFEGTMFTFTFCWPGTLQKAHEKEYPGESYATPYGVVFANLMAAMVLGAILFNYLTHTEKARSLSFFSPTLLLGLALCFGAISFFIAALSQLELLSFLSFLLLEFCNGIYVPSMAYHRGMIVQDSGRALIYGLMNIPLFIFVVAAIWATSNGVEHRFIVFSYSSIMLGVATVAVILGLGIPNAHQGFLRVSTSVTDNVKSVDREIVRCSSETKRGGIVE